MDGTNSDRVIYHLARARLLIDALAETDLRHAHKRCLRIVAAELDLATNVLRGTASPKHWQPRAPICGCCE